VGQAAFRGLERAWDNLGRLRAFLRGLGWRLPVEVVDNMRGALAAYLAAEQRALAQGRGYATATGRTARGLADELGLKPGPWEALWQDMDRLPAPDFLGLRALARLAAAPKGRKRRRRQGRNMVLEVVDGRGQALAQAALPWIGPADEPEPQNQARVETVWRALPQAPAP